MRPGFRSVTQVPSWIYQRYSRAWQRVVLATGWAVLYLLVDAGIGARAGPDGGALPVQWRVVLTMCILLGGLFNPIVAYAAFVAAVAYPLYLVSIYVMALALAVLILASPLAARYLPLALMLVGAPLLSPVHLTPVLPLLFGLWASQEPLGHWGRTGSAVAGGLCALWLKICAGMSGFTVDLWPINGWSMSVAPIYDRFHAVDSLQTLVQLIEPFTVQEGGNTSTVLLYNLLQILAWAAAAYVVAAVRDVLLLRKLGRAGRGSAWTSVLSLVPGLVVIWTGYVAVPSWLQVPGPRWLLPLWLPAQVVLAGVMALGIDGLLRYLQQPMMAQQRVVPVALSLEKASRQRRALGRSWLGRVARPRTKDIRPLEGEDRVPALSQVSEPPVASGRKAEGQPRRDQGDDIIMIELD